MIRAVFDANVIVAGLPSKAGTLASLIDRWHDQTFELVLSDYILDEIARAWAHPYWQSRLTPDEVAESLRLLRRQAEFVSITADITGVASHVEDDMVVATALSANAEYLVSGDKELQDLGAYGGVQIVSPRQFLAILDEESA